MQKHNFRGYDHISWNKSQNMSANELQRNIKYVLTNSTAFSRLLITWGEVKLFQK